MPSPELVAEYHALMRAAGLSLAQIDEETWLKILRTSAAVTRSRAPDMAAQDEQQLRADARELAKNGGIWNTRFQRLVPGVLQAANSCIGELAAETGHALRIPEPDNLFFGEFPTGDFNAHVRPARTGYLVLVNTGLAELFSQCCSLLSPARRFADHQGSAAEMTHSAAEFVVAIARKYHARSSWVAVSGGLRGFQETKADVRSNEWTLEAMLAFVVAHEISHVILQHCDASSRDLMMGASTFSLKAPTSWKREISADTLGTLILEHWCVDVLSRAMPPEEASTLLADAFMAPLFFLECEKLISTADGFDSGGDAASSTHPPSAMRQRFVVDVLRSRSQGHKHLLRATSGQRKFVREVRRLVAEWRDNGTLGNVKSFTGSVEDGMDFLLQIAEVNGLLQGEADREPESI